LSSKFAFNAESGAFRAGTPKLLIGREGQVATAITHVPAICPVAWVH